MAMLEIELKYPLSDRDVTEVWAALTELGAAFQDAHTERDDYYSAPDRDFAATGEAFRIRRMGKKARLTYKGARQPGVTKTRLEIEVPLAPGESVIIAAADLFEALHFRRVAKVEKHRETWTLEHQGFSVNLCFDDVSYIGRFLEIEILAGEEHKDQAEAVILSLAQALSLPEPESRSYLRMVLERDAS